MNSLLRYRRVEGIVGDLLRLRAQDVARGDLAVVESTGRDPTLARAVDLHDDQVVLQVFVGTQGLAADCQVRFLGRRLDVAFSGNICGRICRGSGATIDGGPSLEGEPARPRAAGPAAARGHGCPLNSSVWESPDYRQHYDRSARQLDRIDATQ